MTEDEHKEKEEVYIVTYGKISWTRRKGKKANIRGRRREEDGGRDQKPQQQGQLQEPQQQDKTSTRKDETEKQEAKK